eukprot:13116194-Alexandrium_andersonii.AAC.1
MVALATGLRSASWQGTSTPRYELFRGSISRCGRQSIRWKSPPAISEGALASSSRYVISKDPGR